MVLRQGEVRSHRRAGDCLGKRGLCSARAGAAGRDPGDDADPWQAPEKPSIVDYAQKVQEAGYTDYSRTVEPKPGPKPGEFYVISPDEFGEIEEYTKVSLTHFADGVLADECGEVVDNVEEIVGDALEHIGEYEEDCVHVRNDARRCDYEILEDLREFSEFQETLPPNH